MKKSLTRAVTVSVAASAVGVALPPDAALAQTGYTERIHLAKLLTPGKKRGQTTTDTTTPSLSSATLVVDAGASASYSGANDVTVARALFRSASYPESNGGLESSASLLNGLNVKFARAINAEYGSYVDGAGVFVPSDRLSWSLPWIKQYGLGAHVVVGQRKPAAASTPAHLWTSAEWAAYEDYAYRLIRYVAVQFDQTGFQETLFEVGNEIDITQDVQDLWTLENPAVAQGDETRYQHYMRVFAVWSRAVDRVARENPGRSIKIAGPAMGGQTLFLTNGFWHERFIADTVAGNLRLDVVTHHFFGDILNGWPNVPGSSLRSQLTRIRDALVAKGKGTLPIAITEYGPSEGSDSVFGHINYGHESAAWGAMFINEAVAGTASAGSLLLVRDNFAAETTGVPTVASFNHIRSGVDYPKPVYNAFRMYTLLPGARKGVTSTQPDVRGFASADATSAGVIAYNYNFRFNYPTDYTDLTTSKTVTPGFSNLPFSGGVTVERYVIDANTSNVARFIDAGQTPDFNATMLTRVESCAATVTEGKLLLPSRTLGPSAVSMWLVKSGAASGLATCGEQTADTSTGTGGSTGGSTTDPSTGTGGSTTDPSTGTGGSTTDPSTGTGGSTTDPSTGTGGSTTPDTSTGTGGSTSGTQTGGSQDFASRCAAAGVIRCVSFDSAADIAGGAGSNTGIGAGTHTAPVIDATLSASGAGSLKFTIPSNSGSDSSGSYFANFSPDLSVQFGENSEFYVQWRQRFSPEFISTFYQGSGGIKQAIITTGDQPNRLFASCEATEVVVQTYYMKRFPILYNSCTGSASHGPYDGFYERIANYDFKLQNARPTPYCLYSQDPNNYFPPNGNCFGWFPNEWMTFQVRIKTGPLVNGEWTNSYVTLWAARDGQPSEMVINWGPYNLTAGPATDNQRFGKVWLLPYQTGKDPSQTHATAYTWYDELIVSRSRIADPVASGTSTGGSTTTQPAADTTAPATPSALTAAPASTSQIGLSWSASTDAVGVTGYRLERCEGSGCSSFTRIATPTGTSYTDNGLAASTTYSYRIAAHDAAGNVSGYSPVASAATLAAAAPTPAPSPTGGTANAQFSALAANTVMPLPDLTCTDVAGEYAGKCKEVTGYSGMVYDRNRSRMMLFGAGHGGSNYDGIPTLDMNTLKWAEEYQPTACSSMTFSNYSFDLGAWLSGSSGPYPRPAARHTLDEMLVLGDELIVLARVEGNAPCVQTNGAYTSYELVTAAKVAHYDLVGKTWSFAGTRGALNYAASEYDPISKKIILLGDWGLEVYDPVTRTKTNAIDLGRVYGVYDEQGNIVSAAELAINKSLVYYPPNQKMYYFGSTHVFEVTLDRTDFSKSRITKLNTTGTPASLAADIGGGFAYDSTNKIIGGSLYQNTFSAYNPLTKSWTSKVVQGGAPGSTSWHTIAYDDVNNVFVFVTMDKKAWAYRYGNGM